MYSVFHTHHFIPIGCQPDAGLFILNHMHMSAFAKRCIPYQSHRLSLIAISILSLILRFAMLVLTMFMMLVFFWSRRSTAAYLPFFGHLLQTSAFINTQYQIGRQFLYTFDVTRLIVFFIPLTTITLGPFANFPFSRTWLRIATHYVLVNNRLWQMQTTFVNKILGFRWCRMLAYTTYDGRLNTATARFIARTETSNFPHEFLTMFAIHFTMWACGQRARWGCGNGRCLTARF